MAAGCHQQPMSGLKLYAMCSLGRIRRRVPIAAKVVRLDDNGAMPADQLQLLSYMFSDKAGPLSSIHVPMALCLRVSRTHFNRICRKRGGDDAGQATGCCTRAGNRHSGDGGDGGDDSGDGGDDHGDGSCPGSGDDGNRGGSRKRGRLRHTLPDAVPITTAALTRLATRGQRMANGRDDGGGSVGVGDSGGHANSRRAHAGNGSGGGGGGGNDGDDSGDGGDDHGGSGDDGHRGSDEGDGNEDDGGMAEAHLPPAPAVYQNPPASTESVKESERDPRVCRERWWDGTGNGRQRDPSLPEPDFSDPTVADIEFTRMLTISREGELAQAYNSVMNPMQVCEGQRRLWW